MATLQNSSICVCPSNSDSPLSTTANILSILTFGYVLVLSSLYTFTIRWSSSGDLLNVRSQLSILHQRYESANKIYRVLPGRKGPRSIDEALGFLNQSIELLEDEVEKLPLKAEGSGERWYLVWRHLMSMKRRRRWRLEVQYMERILGRVEAMIKYIEDPSLHSVNAISESRPSTSKTECDLEDGRS